MARAAAIGSAIYCTSTTTLYSALPRWLESWFAGAVMTLMFFLVTPFCWSSTFYWLSFYSNMYFCNLCFVKLNCSLEVTNRLDC